MDHDTLKLMILVNQHLIDKADKISVARDLCGLQSQFLSNAFHSLFIRTREQLSPDSWGEGLVKTWTIRGTVHVISAEDLGLFLTDLTAEKIDEWKDGWAVTAGRKKYFADLIIKLIENGITDRAELKERCFQAGMTETEAPDLFHQWGGIIRELCEKGRICYKVQEKKSFILCPPFESMDFNSARLEIVRRYFTNYGPATIKDAAYFLGVPQRDVKNYLDQLPYSTVLVENKTYYYIPQQKNYNQDISRCIFLAGFDPLMLGYEKKESLFLPPEYLRCIFNLAGIVMPSVLYNGKVIGKWKRNKRKLMITPFEYLTESMKRDISDAAEQLWGDVIPVYSDM